MYNTTKMKNIEIPENLFSNLGESKYKKKEVQEDIIQESNEIIKNIQEDSNVKLTNYKKWTNIFHASL